MSDNIDAFRTASRRVEIVVATGGLGPTADDLTREALAEAFHLPLELRPEALEHIETLFASRKRPMPERNRIQAMFPFGARIIDNPYGTAPGIDLIVANSNSLSTITNVDRSIASRIFSLPGVPAEMMQMYTATVEPRLIQEMGLGTKRWYYHSLKVFGIGESDVEKILPDLIHRDRDPIVGITVSQATITLRISALCSHENEFRNKIQSTIDEIHKQLGLLVFGEGEIDIDEVAHRLMLAKGVSLGVVEVGSGAWIQHRLAKLSQQESKGLQASRWFPSLEALEESWIARSAEDSRTYMALAAERFRQEHDLDLCLVAGIYPTWGAVSTSKSLPSSDFSFSLARRGKETKQTLVSLGAHPDVLYHRIAKAGLNLLRLELLQHG